MAGDLGHDLVGKGQGHAAIARADHTPQGRRLHSRGTAGGLQHLFPGFTAVPAGGQNGPPKNDFFFLVQHYGLGGHRPHIHSSYRHGQPPASFFRSSRPVPALVSSISRMEAVRRAYSGSPRWRGRGMSTGTTARTVPGRADMTTTLSARYTASSTPWVTKRMVVL